MLLVCLHSLDDFLDVLLDPTPALHFPAPALSFGCLFHFLLESAPATLHFLGDLLAKLLELSPALAVHLLHLLEAAPAPLQSLLQLILGMLLVCLHSLDDFLDVLLDPTPALHFPAPALSFGCLFHFLLESAPATLHFLGDLLAKLLELSPALAVHLLHLLEAAPAPLQSLLQLTLGMLLVCLHSLDDFLDVLLDPTPALHFPATAL